MWNNSIKWWLILTMLIIISIPTFILAQTSGYTVEGIISFNKTGDIYLKLLNAEQFERDINGIAPITSYQMILKPGSEDIEKKQISFKFDDVSTGLYVVSCFQDVNGNGKMDMGLVGPAEPWGMYRVRPLFKPVFKKVAFEVDCDLKDIKIEVK